MRTGETIRCRTLTLLLAVSVISGCLESGSKTFSGEDTNGANPNASNSAPLISGSPSSAILVGDDYSFAPSASDTDGDALTFSTRNLPSWATFDSATGRLSGQVLLGDIGVYDAIRISVSDGAASTSLPDFSITVTQTALGSMTLSWTAPTLNTDGTPLTNLAGYNIYFGPSQGNYPNQIRINNPSISTYLVDNLLPNTYYVVASSFNTLGVESDFSNVAVKTVTSD